MDVTLATGVAPANSATWLTGESGAVSGRRLISTGSPSMMALMPVAGKLRVLEPDPAPQVLQIERDVLQAQPAARASNSTLRS